MMPSSGPSRAQRLAIFRQLRQLRPAHDELDFGVAAADVERLDVSDRRAQIGVLAHLLPNLLHDVALAVVAAERRQRIEREEPHRQPVDREDPLRVRRDAHVGLAGVDASQVAAAGRRQHGEDAGDAADIAIDRSA